MPPEHWHPEFKPSRFLSRVKLAQLLERNEAYNASVVSDARAPCILCAQRASTGSRGILLNDRSFLCEACYSEVALISYPERYERLRREFKVAVEARRLAFAELQRQCAHKPSPSPLVPLGWVSLLLLFASPLFLLVTACLLAVGYASDSEDARKTSEWQRRSREWEQANPVPAEPRLRHFHDPYAELTSRDQQILRIFNHWPGYPPFWKYLRAVVLGRDSNRCQVNGCPSRLGLQVHHKQPVASGGSHSPDNLVSLCDFHHALEPEPGHERVWGEIKTQHFTLVCSHERENRTADGTHTVRAHLRRLRLVTLDELRGLAQFYGFACPTCGSEHLSLAIENTGGTVRVECSGCLKATQGPQELPEETGPRLAELLSVTRNKGTWHARWDMLSERKSATWGTWTGYAVSRKRERHRDRIETNRAAPSCPKCGSPMRVITPRPGDRWKAFWGCTQYQLTGCRGSQRHAEPARARSRGRRTLRQGSG